MSRRLKSTAPRLVRARPSFPACPPVVPFADHIGFQGTSVYCSPKTHMELSPEPQVTICPFFRRAPRKGYAERLGRGTQPALTETRISKRLATSVLKRPTRGSTDRPHPHQTETRIPARLPAAPTRRSSSVSKRLGGPPFLPTYCSSFSRFRISSDYSTSPFSCLWSCYEK